MTITYFKRYRMEIDLTDWDGAIELPEGYRFVPWDASLVMTHGDVKYRCFAMELDVNVFPSLGSRKGCRRLMRQISEKDNFVAEATWLVAHRGGEPDFCGTIQGVRDDDGVGSIQNLGITAPHRGMGLGTLLIHRALAGFRSVGILLARLEVTAENDGAVRLYHRLGFRQVRTLYKAAEAVEVW